MRARRRDSRGRPGTPGGQPAVSSHQENGGTLLAGAEEDCRQEWGSGWQQPTAGAGLPRSFLRLPFKFMGSGQSGGLVCGRKHSGVTDSPIGWVSGTPSRGLLAESGPPCRLRPAERSVPEAQARTGTCTHRHAQARTCTHRHAQACTCTHRHARARAHGSPRELPPEDSSFPGRNASLFLLNWSKSRKGFPS